MEIQKVLHLHLEEAKKKPKIEGDYLITEKLDGIYGYMDFGLGITSSIMSRQGREIPSMVHAIDNMRRLINLPTPAFRLIFEIIIPGLDFHEANGILNRSKGECQAYESVIYLHDIIFFGQLDCPAKVRWDRLQLIKEPEVNGLTERKILKVPLLGISPYKDVWMRNASKIWDAGGEGVVLKQADSVYHPGKRNSSLLKIKLEETFFLECIGLYQTIGEKGHANLNAVLRRKSGVTLDVRIGKYSDIALAEEDVTNFIGKVVEVKAMCELPGGKLREPRFVKVTDKQLIEIN